MNVMVSRLKHVSSNILVLWSAVSGVLMSVIYCLSEGTSSILSYRIYETTWIQWTTFIGLSIFFCSNISMIIIVGLSLSGLIAFTTLTLSLQLISPNIVASLRCLELVLVSFFLDKWLASNYSQPQQRSSLYYTIIAISYPITC